MRKTWPLTKKGRGSDPHPSLIYSSIISSLPTHTAKFSDFILSGDSATYGENRENGGLTGFPKIEFAGATVEEAGPPSVRRARPCASGIQQRYIRSSVEKAPPAAIANPELLWPQGNCRAALGLDRRGRLSLREQDTATTKPV